MYYTLRKEIINILSRVEYYNCLNSIKAKYNKTEDKALFFQIFIDIFNTYKINERLIPLQEFIYDVMDNDYKIINKMFKDTNYWFKTCYSVFFLKNFDTRIANIIKTKCNLAKIDFITFITQLNANSKNSCSDEYEALFIEIFMSSHNIKHNDLKQIIIEHINDKGEFLTLVNAIRYIIKNPAIYTEIVDHIIHSKEIKTNLKYAFLDMFINKKYIQNNVQKTSNLVMDNISYLKKYKSISLILETLSDNNILFKLLLCGKSYRFFEKTLKMQKESFFLEKLPGLRISYPHLFDFLYINNKNILSSKNPEISIAFSRILLKLDWNEVSQLNKLKRI